MSASAVTLPASVPFLRRELFLWLSAILCVTAIVQSVSNAAAGSFEDMVNALAGIGAFQMLAWFAVFRLVVIETSNAPAMRQDFFVVAMLGLMTLLPAQRMIWIVATFAAIYIYLRNTKGSHGRAAATVLIALCVQALWGPVFFTFFTSELVRADAALVGKLLEMTQSGYNWHDNNISSQGHSIDIISACSSFHNISLAVLCWVTLTKLKRPTWIATDFIFGVAVCVAMIALNAARLYAMAFDFNGYQYWHDGSGAQIFAVGSSLTILLISLWSTSVGDTRHA